jgi:hypothetical protein
MDMAPVVDTFGMRLTSVGEYARGVLGERAGRRVGKG